MFVRKYSGLVLFSHNIGCDLEREPSRLFLLLLHTNLTVKCERMRIFKCTKDKLKVKKDIIFVRANFYPTEYSLSSRVFYRQLNER